MPSIMEITSRYISRRPSVQECLANNMINYSKLARKISSKHKVSFDAALVACRRISTKLKPGKGIAELMKNSKRTIEVKDNTAKIIIDINIKKDELSRAVDMLNY
jgi:hypothetical protein